VAVAPAVATPRTWITPEPLLTALLMLMVTLDELDTLPPCPCPVDPATEAVDGGGVTLDALPPAAAVGRLPAMPDVGLLEPPSPDASAATVPATSIAINATAASNVTLRLRVLAAARTRARRVTIEPLRMQPAPA
jgi:hypothetical protein